MFLNPWYGSSSGGVDASGPGSLGSVEVNPVSPALSILGEQQSRLRPGWTVHLLETGRFFYCNHVSQTSTWLPPAENWTCGESGLPYGWESAIDKDGKTYFINHLNKSTSYEDPRKDFQEEPPKPRVVELTRDPDMGFGFVAGSEKPVIVRFVTDGGPSVDKLLPGDQILMINGEDVKKAPRDHVIQLVRSCKETVSLTVCQPPLDNSARKSALLSAAKKQRLKNNPSRVRFAESVDINGSTSLSPSQMSSSESTTPFMPNVLKVFLENGQTKSFKYDTSTTVGDVLESLHQKLGIKCQEHFSLVVEHVKSLRRNKLTILDPQETLTKIAARPGAQHLRCLYRITFVPRDAYDMLRKDSVAFEYLYLQCCNDVIQERFSPELKYDVALRLAALHIHQHALSSSSTSSNSKISLKNIERECGLDRFVPSSLVESMKRKELRKLLSHFLKLHGSLTAPGQKQLTALQAKLHYLKIISELPSYGAKCFSTNSMEGNMESVMLISPKFGVSQITGIRSSMPEPICEIEQVTSVAVTREDDLSLRVEIGIKHPDKENLVVSLDDRDTEELILVLQGYYRLFTEKSLAISYEKDQIHNEQVATAAPPYHSCHNVNTTSWSYVTSGEDQQGNNLVDFSIPPPYQQIPDDYKIPNGNISRYSDSESSNSYGGCLRIPFLDSNMNKTVSVYENSGDGTIVTYDSSFNPSVTSATLGMPPSDNNAASHLQIHSAEDKTKISGNSDVMTTSVEMRQIVEDAENYLSDADGEVTDVESVRSESYGKLKHSDSLLLLTQGQKMVTKVDMIETEERSESDTDSQSTPQSSPAHKPTGSSPTLSRPSSIVKTSGSSFGLHSPDNLPMDLDNPQSNIKALIRHLEDNSGLPYTFAEGTLYLDPDIIDLTMIPPPITPDEEGAKMLPSQLSTPPTPFADRETLDQELKALERDVGDLRSLTNHWVENGTLHSLSESSNAGTSDTDDTMSLSSVSTSNTDSMRRSPNPNLVSYLRRSSNNTGPGITLAALRQLGINLREGEDIDSFIANLTIPPPPEGSVALQHYKEARKMGAEYDINDFIIPPPPSNTASDNRSSDIIRRLYEAKEGISRVVGRGSDTEGAEKDKDVCEVKVSSEILQRSPIQSGRVASLQKHFECPITPAVVSYNGSTSSPDIKQKPFKFTKSKLPFSRQQNNKNGVVSNGGRYSRETDARLAEALAENDKMFRSFNSQQKPVVEFGGSRLTDDSNPPPLSPRNRSYSPSSNNITTSSHQQLNQRESENINSSGSSEKRKFLVHAKTLDDESSYQKSGTLSKSASSGDIAIHGKTSNFSSPIKTNKSSVSSEDLRQGNWLESKQSIGSSNDSLTSTSSAATVKSVSVKSLDKEDDPPELPPRNNAKINVKPPLPKSFSQDSGKYMPSVKGIRTPSPIRRARRTPSPETGDKPPAVPSRIRKISPPTNTLPLPQKTRIHNKSPAPKPPITTKDTESVLYNGTPSETKTLPKKINISQEDEKPVLPTKTLQHQNRKAPSSIMLRSSKNSAASRQRAPDNVSIKNTYNQDPPPPLHTSSPKLPPKAKFINGKSTFNDLEDSLDSGSFDQDSLEESEEIEAMLPASREAYRQTVQLVSESVKRLTEMVSVCSKSHLKGENQSNNEENFQKMKEALTSESRQFVTASKLFVKSATESEEVLLNSLSKCVTILRRMVDLSEHVVENTSTPLQTQNVVLKVRDVATAYLSTVRAALSASGRGMDHPSMNTLMGQATSLAGVLTALMRTLKVFTP